MADPQPRSPHAVPFLLVPAAASVLWLQLWTSTDVGSPAVDRAGVGPRGVAVVVEACGRQALDAVIQLFCLVLPGT